MELESSVIFNPKLTEHAKQIAPKAVCQKLWKAAGALGAQCIGSVLSILLFAFKNIPTYVEAQFGWFFPSPASLEHYAWTHSASRLASNNRSSEFCHKILLIHLSYK